MSGFKGVRSVLLCVGVSLLSPNMAMAARIITIEISRDGQRILKGRSSDLGMRNGHHVWRDLKTAQLNPEPGVLIEPDNPGGKTATLKGRIHILVWYGAKADVSELHLVRAQEDAQSWSVADDDVELIAKSLGLPAVTEKDLELAKKSGDRFVEPVIPLPAPPKPAISTDWAPIAIGAFAAIGLIAAAAFLWVRMRRQTR